MNDIFNENVPLKTETPAFVKHVLPAVPSSEVYLEDCVTALKRYADKHFDLAIVDPPYGCNWGGIEHILSGDKNKSIAFAEKAKKWDVAPNKEYFTELKRVSKNQIIWGYNYLTDHLGNSNNLIIWDKKITGLKYLSRFEIAYCSFNNSVIKQINSIKDDKIHPTQKPVKLYDWLLHNYAKPNDLILDTHLGSGSSRIAAYKGGFNFVGFEIDQEYYEKQEKRFNDFKSQLRLF
jgi:site-specific DNA-methyltransferase (adenine-specific)